MVLYLLCKLTCLRLSPLSGHLGHRLKRIRSKVLPTDDE
jgi:hypothetical protein